MVPGSLLQDNPIAITGIINHLHISALNSGQTNQLTWINYGQIFKKGKLLVGSKSHPNRNNLALDKLRALNLKRPI